MAVAAYASVLSVLHVLNQIQHPVHLRLLLNTNKIQTLHEHVSFLQEFLEIPLGANSEDIEDLTRQIAEVANEAEDISDFHVVNQLDEENEEKCDIIETHVVDQLLEGSENKTDTRLSSSFCQDIDKVIEKIDSIKKKLTMVKGKCVVQGQQSRASVTASPSRLPSNGRKNTMVGFDDHLVRIMDKLTGHQLNLEIIPIAGMGVSQQYSVREILQGILQGIGVFEDSFELGTRLYQHLSGRRYLIVMDDMWSTEAWDDLRLFFPDNRKGSRIMITTRLLDVAISLSSRNLYSMDFLDEDKSWGLLCEKAFSQGSASPELEDIGKKIARSCRGLPLAIVVIGGLLGNSNMTREYWEFIAENVISYANSENDEHCLKIVALSYNHLPIHLKPCFLYMRAFPEDHEVPVSELIKFWVAEGFLKPITTKTFAEEYLKSLIDRSLILIRRRGRTGKIRTCGVHDVLRDLCLRESRKEQFFGLPKVQHPIYFARERGEHACFLCCKRVMQEMIHLPRVHLDSGSTSLISSFVCNSCRIICPQYICLR
ncbi:hypothetical protein BUALT_Bualt07G0024500 [Buddleja alternifolia]|uniref:Uncharacterized protein n=1 Tax=Buddleja alternifolia TaxID=168488 RepID=A0AAV6X8W6_9LAMI|nr:hypothetical protein BUALT_Bualt07G0024500 [Buddleja alternifolia]